MKFIFENCGINLTVILSILYSSRFTFWKSNFAKTTRQNFIVNKFLNRVNISLSEYTFLIKFCRIAFEKFDFQKVERERYTNERITVRNYFKVAYFFARAKSVRQRHNFFTNRVVPRWNKLPEKVLLDQSLIVFKPALDQKILAAMDITL